MKILLVPTSPMNCPACDFEAHHHHVMGVISKAEMLVWTPGIQVRFSNFIFDYFFSVLLRICLTQASHWDLLVVNINSINLPGFKLLAGYFTYITTCFKLLQYKHLYFLLTVNTLIQLIWGTIWND